MGTPGDQDLGIKGGTKLFDAVGVAIQLGEKCLGASPEAKVR